MSQMLLPYLQQEARAFRHEFQGNDRGNAGQNTHNHKHSPAVEMIVSSHTESPSCKKKRIYWALHGLYGYSPLHYLSKPVAKNDQKKLMNFTHTSKFNQSSHNYAHYSTIINLLDCHMEQQPDSQTGIKETIGLVRPREFWKCYQTLFTSLDGLIYGHAITVSFLTYSVT